MSSGLARKQCAQCGEKSLEQEWACWACGTPFAAPGDAPTLLPMPPRHQGHAVAAAAGLTVLLVGIGLGFWMARATQEPPVAPESNSAAVAVPQTGAALVPAPSLSGGQPDPPVRLPPPGVGPRPRGNPWGPSAPATPYTGVVPVPSSRAPLSGNAFSPAPYPVPARPRPRTARAPGPATSPPYAPPSHGMRVRAQSGQAEVRLINSDSVTLTVELRGPETLAMDVASGMGLPCRAKPGAYRLLLLGKGGGKLLGSVLLEPGKRATIRFDRSGVRG